jgi:HlyD family secretion protein
MTLRPRLVLLLACPTLLLACSGNGGEFLYTGRTDVEPVTLSAQASGVIDELTVDEGDAVRQGQLLGRINADRLEAQKRQQEAQAEELRVRRTAAEAQIRQAQAQLDFSRETLTKTEKLLAEGGATRQRRDELSNQVTVQQESLAALRSNYRLIEAQERGLRAGMDLTEIAIRDARIVSPVDGVVLERFHQPGELAAVGTPLLELADLSVMTVEIYLPLADLASISLGQQAAVSVDGLPQTLTGTVKWISSESEFTPKTILTRETRSTLVYGVKIRVPNPDGALKVGMPVGVKL